MQASTKKRILKISVIAAATILLLFLITLAANAGSTKKYWSETDTNLQFDVDKYSKKLDKFEQDYAQVDQAVQEAIKTAQPLSDEHQKRINQINEAIVKYFLETHQIDFTQEMSKLQAKVLNLDANQLSFNITGYYNYALQDNTVYLSSELLGKSRSYDFDQTYIHETVHYLSPEDDQTIYIYEGITEVVTEKICAHADIYYGEITSYEHAITVAKNLLKAYPEIEYEIFTADEQYNIQDKLDSLLKPGYANQIETLLNLKTNGFNRSDVNFYIQYITCEYMKKADMTSDMKLSKFFGIKWMVREFFS